MSPTNKHIQFALGKFAELNKNLRLCESQPEAPERYYFYNVNVPNAFDEVTIDHIFCHGLIKGLRIAQLVKFYCGLMDLLEIKTIYGDPLHKTSFEIRADWLQAIHVATVDQLLDAYYRTLHGKEKS